MEEREQETKETNDTGKPEEAEVWRAYSRAERIAARIGLLACAVGLLILLYGILHGFTVETVAVTAVMLMIAVPVLLWLMLWSVSKMRERSEAARQWEKEMNAKMIDTVVFDIGNVLTDFTWEAWMAQSGYPQDVLDRVAEASVKHPVWNEIDRGVWTYEEFVDAIVKNAPELETEIRNIFAQDFHAMISKRERAVPWVDELRAAGYRVLYLSNFSERAHRECTDALSFMDHCDGGLMSYTEHLTKPEKAFYERLMERYDITPEHAVFIDDRKNNIDAARELGMRGILYESQAQAEEELRELGVTYG